jgi:hypothetical protein
MGCDGVSDLLAVVGVFQYFKPRATPKKQNKANDFIVLT